MNTRESFTPFLFLVVLVASSQLGGCAAFFQYTENGEAHTYKKIDIKKESRAVLARYFTPRAVRSLRTVPIKVKTATQQNFTRIFRRRFIDPYGNVVGYQDSVVTTPDCHGRYQCGRTECSNFGKPRITITNSPCCFGHDSRTAAQILIHEYTHCCLDMRLIDSFAFAPVFQEMVENPEIQNSGIAAAIDADVDASMAGNGPNANEEQLWQERVAYTAQRVALHEMPVTESMRRYFAPVLADCGN